MEYSIDLAAVATRAGVPVLFSHLEDLGVAEVGDPGSLWNWKEVEIFRDNGGLSHGGIL